MNTIEIDRFSGPMPALPGNIICIGQNYFKVDQLEKFYYRFRNLVAGVDVGMTSTTYQIPQLVPSKKFVHYLYSIGINGRIEVQLSYQAGAPRNSPGAVSNNRFNRHIARYTDPYINQIAIVNGDTLEANVLVDFANVKAEIWFYGWKIMVKEISSPTDQQKASAIILSDVREIT